MAENGGRAAMSFVSHGCPSCSSARSFSPPPSPNLPLTPPAYCTVDNRRQGTYSTFASLPVAQLKT